MSVALAKEETYMLLAAIALLAQLSPAQAATPPPEIIHVTSSPFCSTLRDSVRPAIAGLMKDDQIIDAGHNAFLRLAAAQRAGGGQAQIHAALTDAVRALDKNLATIDGILANPAEFAAASASSEASEAADIKAKLLAIASNQKLVANAINGTYETAALGQMQTELPLGSPIAEPDGPQSQLGAQSAPLLASAGIRDPQALDTTFLLDEGGFGTSAGDRLAALVASNEAETQTLEATAATAILHAAANCSANGP
jgi:hypothetical protein